MKKVIIFIVIAVVAAAAGVFVFFNSIEKNMTDSSKLKTFSHAEFTVKLPQNMKPKKNLYTVSTGEEEIAYYSNTQACCSISKIPYSANEYLKDMDIEKYCQNLKINGESITIYPVGDGFYYYRDVEASNIFKNTTELFNIEAIFKGENAVYSIVTQCRAADKAKYKDIMISWIETFQLKN